MKTKLTLLVVLITNVFFAQNFHDTQGKLEISNSGQATYTLPIAMPPSIKDVGPIINLVYASGQQGGIAGQGWNINNISNIARMSTRQDIEGYRDGVDFDADDKLSLDGQRLLLKTGTYWADGSTYETEVQSNTKIELKIINSQIIFIVTSPDGSRSWYGNFGGMDGTDSTAYYIVRFEDAYGNFITYHYSKPLNKSLCISEIRFSANTFTNPTALNKIIFTYEQATRTENTFIKGNKIEKAEILKKVEVYTNSLLFKRYQITHVIDNLGYQRVSQLQEFNSAGEAANPILFEYKSTTNDVSENITGYSDSLDLSTSPDMSGDFDGDGKLDFISGNKVYTKLFQGIGSTFLFPSLWNYETKRLLFTATTITNNKLNQKQSVVKADEAIDNITFKIYNLESNGIQNSYSKTIYMDNSGNCSDECGVELYDDNGNPIPNPNSHCTSPTFIKNSNKYIEGDFNGDSISDVLIISYTETKTFKGDIIPGNGEFGKSTETNITDPSDGHCYWHSDTSTEIKEARIIDLNPSSPSADNTFGNFGLTSSNIQLLQNGQRFVMDFNSDGKADILMIENNKNYKVISFKQLNIAPWAELEVIGQGVLDSYSPSKQILFGDFNGDGKPDIMIPDTDGNCVPINFPPLIVVSCPNINLWNIYYSNPNPNGGDFFVKSSYPIVDYITIPATSYPADTNNYYAMDINKDGKSDLVKVHTSLWQPNKFFNPKDIDSSWYVESYINNIGLNNRFTFDYHSPWDHNDDDNSRPIPLVSNYKYKGLDSDLLMIRYHGGNSFAKTVTFIDFKKDFSEENLLQKVTQSNGAIVDEIIYDAMVPNGGSNGLGLLDGFYSSAESLEYPLIELKQLATNKIVKQLKNNSLGTIKKQDFVYHGLGVNLNGIGVIGFKKTARSSWYRTNSDKKNWSITENNLNQRGAVVKSFSLLLNGNDNFNFGTNYTNLLNKSENTYTESVDPITKRYALLLNNQTTTDYLTNIVKQKIYNSYSPDYLLPISITNNTLLGNVLHGSTTSITAYDNNPFGEGNAYYIGRPNEVTTTSSVFVNTLSGNTDVKTSNEKYSYFNGNLTRTEKKPNNDAVTLVETFDYFSNGLLKSKTLSAIGTNISNQVSSRTTSYTYDITNRFIKTTTDPELLITTNDVYDDVYGLVKKQTNPFGKSTISTFDNWGKQTKITDFLGKSIIYSYNLSNGIYTTTQVGDDDSSSFVDSDALARKVRKGSKDINGNWVYATSEYDYLGRKTRDSEPFFATSSPSQWTNYEYDDYSRPIKTTAYTGKIITTIYNGLTITATEPAMSKSKTMNANGLVIAATDTPGGTINYKYDANNNLMQSNYDGIVTSMTYDNWGRKSSVTDTSAGTYIYSYNAFGETLTEKTPKGLTTYTLNPIGKPLTKKIVGTTNVSGNNNDENTNITSIYSYDPTYKWLTKIDVFNTYDGNINYIYSYDTIGTNPTMQLNKTVENLPFATFTKQLTFDLFGRVLTENSTAVAHGKTSTKVITHVYKNGAEWQILDGTTVKWQANTVNARGQITSATLGNGIAITNSYDDFGYVTQNKHDLGTTNVMTLNNAFEPILGNLTNRYNSMFDAKESFSYDNLDRLTSWDGVSTNLLNLPFNTTTDGFIFNGTSTQGSVTNATGTLKVILKNTFVSVKKALTINATTDTKLRIKANITNKTGTGGVLVNAVMVETDPTDATNYTEIPFGTIENGLLDANYIVSDFVTNPKLSLKFIIDENSPNGSNGGGPFPPNTTFYVDNLKIDNITVVTQNYDDRGRITQNNLGTYNYTSSAKPYQNSSVFTTTDANTYYGARPVQNISYTAFKAPIKIEEQGVDILNFGYNAMQQRCIMYYGSTSTDKLARPYRKYYSADGSMEVKATFAAGNTTTPTAVEFVTYIGGTAYNAPIVLKSDGTTQSYFYLHRDYQSTILAITNAVGSVVEKRLFDAWGAIVKVQDGAGTNLSKLTFFDRGYTGHEHLQSVGLINMNARLYDPKLHRFLSPDNYVQDPYNTQNYNRYGYCVNNPLKYTDITGNLIGIDDAILIGAGIALASYLTMNLINGVPITLKGALMATFIGAVSGAVTFGIGSAFNNVATFALKATYSALAHGLFQGVLSGIQGGGFWAGAASGAISSMAASLFQGVGYENAGWHGLGGCGATDSTGMIIFGSVMGGAGAALTGGNFWTGAVTGLVVSGLNHAMHDGFAKKYDVTSLHDYEAANGAGHDSLAFENEDGTQHYVSKDGTEGGQNGGVFGKSTYTIGDFDSIDAINDNYAANHDGKRYDITGVYRATRAQINRGIVVAEAIAKSYYCLVGNSCTDVLSMGLSATYGSGFFKTALKNPIPNINFFVQPVLYHSNFTSYNLLQK